jgi:prepilin-type N-terminal cleavage/methylation domain-containing protein
MRRGFSLVELLVSMTIISIVVAVLFPVYAKTRERAWRVACTGHIHQIGLAASQYSMDCDGTAIPAGPYVVWGAPHPAYGEGWIQRLFPYIDDDLTLLCPANSTAAYGYSMNGWTMSQQGSQVGIPPGPYSLERAPAPSQTPWVFDGCNPASDGGPEWSSRDSADCDPDNAASRCHKAPYDGADLLFPGVHGGGNNVVYLDNHGKWWPRFPGSIADHDMDAQLTYFEQFR